MITQVLRSGISIHNMVMIIHSIAIQLVTCIEDNMYAFILNTNFTQPSHLYTIYKVLTLYMSHTQISVFIVGLILSLQGCVLYNLVITLLVGNNLVTTQSSSCYNLDTTLFIVHNLVAALLQSCHKLVQPCLFI